MAQRLTVTGAPARAMPFIFNVSKHVGPSTTSPNEADDVQLVQFLLREVLKIKRGSARTSIVIPQPSGTFDAATGFWIYQLQSSFPNSTTVIDGIVSPAKSPLMYNPQNAWIIVRLNVMLHEIARTVFDGIPNNPELSSSLRASLR